MNIISWNCRGAGGKTFPTLIRDIRREYNANFIILLETHISGSRGAAVRDKIGFDSSFIVEANGHSGGIWCLWDSGSWKVDILEYNQQIVHLRLTGNNAATWLLSAVYGSPQRPNRRSLWIFLRSLVANINLSWCILGDFNALLHDYERQGGTRSANSGAFSDFQSCVSDCGLVDLGYMGWLFTWRRGDLVERLDRGLCNLDWQLAFREASLKHLPNFKSDHTAICLQLSTEASYNRHRRPFRFVAAWISHPDFHRMVENSWNVQDSWSDGIISFKNSLKNWNYDVFGDIFKRKITLLKRLNGITSSLSQGSNQFLEKLQIDLWKEYKNVLNQEELLWYQKSRCKWIEFGDRNTKFFHGSTMIKRRKNKVTSLLDSNGSLITDNNALENMAFSFYADLYNDSFPDHPFVLNNAFPQLNAEDLYSVGRNISELDINEAIFHIGSFKALCRMVSRLSSTKASGIVLVLTCAL
ncbi:uncharacterized protein LOC107627531 [Arachis ipaensis]|uniref:uncharacterized protein LOC107627531 n=1 Tax=Arachis ipaensis TaxID=130454 RepID=UPI0007AFC1A4|nr:uncharacterized protein LOC107627531 [Arachis ipaensis]XP_025636176.1 uncharacterized protein LOC112730297 [Arachis hypogaea]